MARKQSIAILLLLAFMINFLEGYSTIFAASPNANMSFWYASTKATGAISEFNSSYNHGKILYAVIDGETAYCLNYAKSADNGQNMNSYSSAATPLTATQKKYLKYCMYYGFRGTNMNAPSDAQKNKYIATQAMVWIIEKDIFNTSSANSAAKKLCATAPDSDASYDYYISLRDKMISAMEMKLPSFAASTKAGATTYALAWNEDNSRYETTLTDSNKMLAKYNLSLSNVKTSINGNKLTIYSKSSFDGTTTGTMTANNGAVTITGNCVFWRVTGNSSNYQEFVSTVPDAEKITSYIKIKTNAVGFGAIYKKDNDTGVTLSGATYGIYRNKGCTDLVEKLTTDKNGYAKSSALPVGTYYVKEIKAPAGYTLSSTVYTLLVKADETTSFTVTDKGQKGSLTINKKGQVLTGWNGTDFEYETGYLPGAQFTVTAGENIYNADGTKQYSKGDVVAENLVTGEDGTVTLGNLQLGTYIVKEMKAPAGYKINASEKTVKISYAEQTAEVSYASTSITNTRQKAKVEVIKQDGDTSHVLRGAKFGLYAESNIKNSSGKVIVKEGTLLESVLTGSDGKATFSVDLPINCSYYVKELQTPDDYIITEEIYQFDFQYLEQEKASITFAHTFSNVKATGQISIEKVDRETGNSKPQGYGTLEGAEYGLYARNEIVHPDGKTGIIYDKNDLVGTFVTDENGKATLSQLYFGNYYIKEIKAPVGYVLSEEEIDVELKYEGQEVSVVTENVLCTESPVTIEFQKVDSDSKENISGAVLSLLDENEVVLETWTTENDRSQVIKGLEIGKTYILREESAPYGYLKAKDIVFTVEDTDEVQKIVMEDTVPTGTILLNKRGEFLDSVNPVTANGGMFSYLFGYVTGGLAGVKFELYADEDVVSVDGKTVVYRKGQMVTSLVTDREGIASATGLPLGKYYLIETETVDGFVLDSKQIAVELSYQNQETEVVYAGFDVKNERQKVKISVVKSDAENGETLQGVVFGLYAGEDIVNAAGKIILKEDSLIEKVVTNKDGIAEVVSDLVLGKYYLKEIRAIAGYASTEEIFEFEAEYQGQETEVVEIKAEFVNHPLKVEIRKTDITGQNELIGAELCLLNMDGNVIERWTSTGEAHVVERLPVGSYVLREEKASYGYVIAQDVVFEVRDTEEMQKVIMYDETAKGKIVLHKTDKRTGEPLQGVEFEVRSADGTVLETLVTDENGYTESMDYEIGRYENGEFAEQVKYYLVETKALDGYVLSEKVMEVMFEYTSGKTRLIECKLEVTNERIVKESELPKTGDKCQLWWFVIGGGLFLIFYKYSSKN